MAEAPTTSTAIGAAASTDSEAAMLVHGTCLRIGRAGVLLLGAPGSGKSSLALRLLDAPGTGAGETPLTAVLVADDQVRLRRDGDRIFATAPAALAGLLEVRGIGIVRVARTAAETRLDLAVRLVARDDVPRLPEAEDATEIMAPLGIALPVLRMCGHEAAAPARLRAALRHLGLA